VFALVLALFALGAIHHYAGTPGLILTLTAFALYLLLRTRPFTQCGRCRGHGARTRILGDPVPCRPCRGTGYGTRSDRRKAERIPAARARR
jgi:hypothetical protein